MEEGGNVDVIYTDFEKSWWKSKPQQITREEKISIEHKMKACNMDKFFWSLQIQKIQVLGYEIKWDRTNSGQWANPS